MKRLVWLLMACFLSLGLLAQEEILQRKLAETRVEPPQFTGEIIMKPQVTVEKSPICCFIQEKLNYPGKASDFYQEGLVVIEFTVEPDATVSNFKVVNPVSHELNTAVINCLKLTNGMWIPGKVNGIPSAMEKKVTVMFDLEDTPSLVEQARYHYMRSLKAFYKGRHFQDIIMVNAHARARKEKHQFSRSLKQLNLAQKYCYDDTSVLYWQAKNYQELGNKAMFNKKMEEFNKVLNIRLASSQLKENYDVAWVVLNK
jgi:hypothetical protein